MKRILGLFLLLSPVFSLTAQAHPGELCSVQAKRGEPRLIVGIGEKDFPGEMGVKSVIIVRQYHGAVRYHIINDYDAATDTYMAGYTTPVVLDRKNKTLTIGERAPIQLGACRMVGE